MGLFDIWLAETIRQMTYSTDFERTFTESTNQAKGLTLSDLHSLYMAWMLGIVASVANFILEITVYLTYHRRKL